MNCIYCHTEINKDEQTVSCGGCESILHLECWAANGSKCAVFGCDHDEAFHAQTGDAEIESVTMDRYDFTVIGNWFRRAWNWITSWGPDSDIRSEDIVVIEETMLQVPDRQRRVSTPTSVASRGSGYLRVPHSAPATYRPREIRYRPESTLPSYPAPAPSSDRPMVFGDIRGSSRRSPSLRSTRPRGVSQQDLTAASRRRQASRRVSQIASSNQRVQSVNSNDWQRQLEERIARLEQRNRNDD